MGKSNATSNDPGRYWSYFIAFVAFSLLIGAGWMGWNAVNFAQCNNTTGALVALALAVFWSAILVALLVAIFSGRRVSAKMQARVVEQTVQNFLNQLKNLEESNSTKDSASIRAELMDRLHSLAAKSLETTNRRP